jgi:hypothetical protein
MILRILTLIVVGIAVGGEWLLHALHIPHPHGLEHIFWASVPAICGFLATYWNKIRSFFS